MIGVAMNERFCTKTHERNSLAMTGYPFPRREKSCGYDRVPILPSIPPMAPEQAIIQMKPKELPK